MSTTLYRKYRPQQFADIHGQDGITTTLKNQVASGKIGHAYLFAGTRGTGKTTAARVLAKALNCHERAAGECEPCGQCSSCTDIAAGRSIDVLELDGATHTGVDTVREEIIENALVLPTRDRYKIFIIDEVHMLSTSSFNALLKSIEEPPAHVVYILATTEIHKIPPTVASRCQRFVFRPLPLDVMQKKLASIATAEGVAVDDAVIHRVLAASGGAMRDAESIMGQLLSFGERHITDPLADAILAPSLFSETLELSVALARGDSSVCFALIETLFERGVDMQSLHDGVIRRCHELLVTGACSEPPRYLGLFSDSERAQLIASARSISAHRLSVVLESLLEKRVLYKTISVPTMPLHLVVGSIATPPAITVAAPAPEGIPELSAPRNTPMSLVTPPSNVQQHRENISVSEEALRSAWSATVQGLISEMPSLGIILSTATVREVKGTEIMLSVTYPMHREKLSAITVKRRIEERMTELCGTSVTFAAHYMPPEQNAEVTALLDTFGGHIVA